jgi:signal peptidase I
MRVWVRIAIGVGIAVLVVRTFLLQGIVTPLFVAGDSMVPTLEPGQRLVIDRTAFWFQNPRRLEVVVLQCPGDPLAWCVKRIAGTPGERVQIRGGQLYVDDEPCDWPVRLTPFPGVDPGVSREYRLGPGEYFVLGDNPDTSDDSRSWTNAAIREETVAGKALWIKR